MRVKSFLKDGWFRRGVIILWLISSALVLVLLKQIDGIVHGTLYSYGLRFDYGWAQPYWSLLNLAFVCLAFPMVLGGILLFSSFLRTGDGETRLPDRARTSAQKIAQTSAQVSAQTSPQTSPRTSAQTSPQVSAQTSPQTGAQASAPTSPRASARTGARTSARAIHISCPSCRRVFSKPLILLDFSGGEESLVSVCPYCNAVLGSAKEKHKSVDVVVDLKREVVDEKEPGH